MYGILPYIARKIVSALSNQLPPTHSGRSRDGGYGDIIQQVRHNPTGRLLFAVNRKTRAITRPDALSAIRRAPIALLLATAGDGSL